MKYSYLVLALGAMVLAACTGPIIMGSDAAIIAATRPSSPPPADTKDQIPEHEEWCYGTMGDPQCYAHVQNVPPERLINVDPQNHYPVDLHAYRDALVAKPDATAAPVALEPASAAASEKDMLKQEINETSPPVVSKPAQAAAP